MMDTKEYKRNWYLKNRDRILKQRKLYHRKHRKKILKRAKRYRDSNNEKVSAQKKKCYYNKIDQYKSTNRKWREKNKKRKSLVDKNYRELNKDRIKARTSTLVFKSKRSKQLREKYANDLNYRAKITDTRNKYFSKIPDHYVKNLLKEQGIKITDENLIEIKRTLLKIKRYAKEKQKAVDK